MNLFYFVGFLSTQENDGMLPENGAWLLVSMSS